MCYLIVFVLLTYFVEYFNMCIIFKHSIVIYLIMCFLQDIIMIRIATVFDKLG